MPNDFLLLIAVALIVLCAGLARWTYWQLVPLFLGGGQYVPTGEGIMCDMLALAELTAHDVVYDLGSGDGRLVIEAVRTSGCHGVGIEIDPHLVHRSERAAHEAGVDDRARFVAADMWTQPVSDATVVLLFQVPRTMSRLEQKLQNDLKPGTRLISNYFVFPTWKPAKTVGRIHLYIR